MTNFCKLRDKANGLRMRHAAIWRAITASAIIAASLPSGASASAGDTLSEATDQRPGEEDDGYAGFLAKYVAWSSTVEAEGLEQGTPLTATQIELASLIGIEHPEKVRLVYADAVPFPNEDEEMRKIGENLGFIGPGITNNAQAFGYTIWVRNGFTLDRPSLAHELVHVAQIERADSFGDYVEEYMKQLLEYGHADMPLEVEAYEANREYKKDSIG
ncbi:hypothetical protein [Croceicoccus sp. Ery5]|uniref:hypothetical protein n=1 Tax=Croceicoccus sp. Ery5 TaxID=1703340 RepID=UPI001E41B098|nr:hypothetical protein [Croceicoccus sp. Ery5]